MASTSPTTSQNPAKKKNWHKIIAKNRGESWRKNMLAGRRDALLNPSQIRLLRLKGNVHQEEIAKKLGLSESTYGAIERGKRLVSGELAKKIADQFGIDKARIFKFVKHNKYVAIVKKSI